jgi:DNA-binding protein Fis
MQRLNFFLPQPTIQRLREHSKTNDVPMADAVRRALEQYLKQQQPQQANQGAH